MCPASEMRRAASGGMPRKYTGAGCCRTRSLFSAAITTTCAPVLLLLTLFACSSAMPLQYLPEIPGYIPVYIRLGDQPLEEINPALAEAFHESSGLSKNIQDISLDEAALEDLNSIPTEKSDVPLEENTSLENTQPNTSSKQLIYDLPEDKIDLSSKSKPSEKASVVMKIPKPQKKIDVKEIIKEAKEKEGNN